MVAVPSGSWRPPRAPFLIGFAGAALAWWLAGDATPRPPPPVLPAPPPLVAVVDTLKPDQTLSGIWEKHGLDYNDLPAVVHAGQSLFPWTSLRAGSVYRFLFEVDGSLRGLDLTIDRDRRLVVRRKGDRFHGRLVKTEFERRERSVAACIEISPWQALSQAGEDPSLTVTLAEIFGGQIDFFTDLRRGDCFDAVFTVDERPDGSYRLVTLDAARFRLGPRTHEAYRFSSDGEKWGYYDGEGRSLKRQFLRSPLKYTRISSRFGVRMHPILRRRRDHPGVDYAAPVGTPVQAAGDGVVSQAGRNGGYGLYVKLKHGRRYYTSYAHLSRIAKGVRAGARVQQGQVIGHVGSTGLSTGPHLDYRFIENGKYVDPLRIIIPAGPPLEGGDLETFSVVREAFRDRLEQALQESPPIAVPQGSSADQ